VSLSLQRAKGWALRKTKENTEWTVSKKAARRLQKSKTQKHIETEKEKISKQGKIYTV